MTAPQIVFSTVTALVAVAVALVWTGVALAFGVAWGFIVGGTLLGGGSVAAGWVLLREGSP